MSDTDRPAHLRLYSDAVTALPLPGERMTVAAYEQIRDLLWEDAKAREPKDGEAEGDDGRLWIYADSKTVAAQSAGWDAVEISQDEPQDGEADGADRADGSRLWAEVLDSIREQAHHYGDGSTTVTVTMHGKPDVLLRHLDSVFADPHLVVLR